MTISQEISKSEKTRQFIIEKSALVFNQKGYAGTSISDIMAATGLTKGGVYGHFESKEEIAVEAFRYSMKLIGFQMQKVVDLKSNAIDKLNALVAFHKNYLFNPPIQGGCPLLNTSVEADDTNPRLREKVIKALNNWHLFIQGIVEEGKRKKEIKTLVNADEFTTLFIALTEGAVMLSKAYGDPKKLNTIFKRINELINTELVP